MQAAEGQLQPGPPVISLAPPQGATLNQPYAFTFGVTQGTQPITFSATGPLPPGLSPVTSAGVLAGTPTTIGTFPIVVRAVNGGGQSVTQNFTIQVFQHGFRLSGSMLHPLGFHSATLLTTGQVLIAGGFDASSAYDAPTASAELFDPMTQTFMATGSMHTPRVFHTATLLCDTSAITCSDLQVLVAGGEYGTGYPTTIATTELFDPVTGTFTSTGSLLAPREGHTATLLGDGKVLIAGGETLDQLSQPSLAAGAELFDPGTATFTATGSLNVPRNYHTATLLKNGKVLIAGGLGGNNGIIGEAELYDPATGLFTPTGSMVHPRYLHSATMLTSGSVLLVGGEGTGADAGGVAAGEIYDPDTTTFTATGALVTPPPFFSPDVASVLLPDGTVLVKGGAYAELFDPITGTFSETGGLQIGYVASQMTALGTNSQALVLVTGSTETSQVAEVYQ
jgi:hypothetical protein